MKVKSSSVTQDEKCKRSQCRRWRLVVNTDQGRRFRRFRGTYTQAVQALAEWVSELSDLVPCDETFEAYAESWRAWRAKSCGLDEGTLSNDESHARVLSRALGDRRMDSITPEAVKAALVDIKEGGPRELSGTYMNNLFTTLNSIMQTAADDGRIASNPCARIKPPRCDTAEKEALSSARMDKLWRSALPHATAGDGRAMCVLLLLDCGLRLGEALALDVADVDLRARAVRVRASVKERTGNVGKTKRPASVRDLPMTDRLAEACSAYVGGREDGPFLASPRGMRIRAQNFRRWWEKMAVEWKCPGFTPHQLRHSNLTKMARFMTPFDLQRWAGWSSIAPAKVYVHADQSALEAAVRRSQIAAVSDSNVIECVKTVSDSAAGQTA